MERPSFLGIGLSLGVCGLLLTRGLHRHCNVLNEYIVGATSNMITLPASLHLLTSAGSAVFFTFESSFTRPLDRSQEPCATPGIKAASWLNHSIPSRSGWETLETTKVYIPAIEFSTSILERWCTVNILALNNVWQKLKFSSLRCDELPSIRFYSTRNAVIGSVLDANFRLTWTTTTICGTTPLCVWPCFL